MRMKRTIWSRCPSSLRKWRKSSRAMASPEQQVLIEVETIQICPASTQWIPYSIWSCWSQAMRQLWKGGLEKSTSSHMISSSYQCNTAYTDLLLLSTSRKRESTTTTARSETTKGVSKKSKNICKKNTWRRRSQLSTRLATRRSTSRIFPSKRTTLIAACLSADSRNTSAEKLRSPSPIICLTSDVAWSTK